METIARQNKLYASILVSGVKLAVFIVLIGIVLLNVQNVAIIKYPLFLLSCIVMSDVFFLFYIGKKLPDKTVMQITEQDVRKALTLQATESLLEGSIGQMIKNLLSKEQIKFFLEKAEVLPNELSVLDVPIEMLLATAYRLARMRNGVYVTTIDLITAYLLLTEDRTKILLKKKIKEDEVPHIAYWALYSFPSEEHPKKMRVSLWGEGIGEYWVSGWTLETKKYTRDFAEILHHKHIHLSAREKEFTELLEALSKPENNNALLIGENGVGKTNLVAAFAQLSFSSQLGKKQNHKKVLELLVNSLLAGARESGELEKRLQAIIDEVSHAHNVVLFIPQLQNVLGVSGLDISGILLPYLRSNSMPVIATMTPAAYKMYFENNPLKTAFTPIELREPSIPEAIQMLLDKAEEIQETNRVNITYTAVTAAVLYASRYSQDDVLPGSAIRLLEDSVAAVLYNAATTGNTLTAETVAKIITVKTHINIAEPTGEEKNVLLHLETLLHDRVIGQDEAVTEIAEALRRVRSGMASPTKPISFLFLGPTGVGKTETAKALASIYFGGEDKMLRFDMSEYAGETGMAKLIGSPASRGELTEKVHDNPFSLVLLDEFEKAHADILNLFLQVFDDGRLTDGQGKTVSFVNTIIIATSNAASELIREHIQQGGGIDKAFQADLVDSLEQQRVFKPELLNRFDGIIAFKPLMPLQLEKVVQLLLQQTAKRLSEQDIAVSFSSAVVKKVAQEGYDKQFGARPLRRYIQDTIESMLAKQVLTNTLSRGARVHVDVSQNGTFTLLSDEGF
ncbi:MAG TPA: ATP-dependent Clp protease ATP-binding subunit [Patescibacteria group bacterium]|nr:ATP-dependent Clp protease ATP-binding subunit [Patescibacteria group bacterium]